MLRYDLDGSVTLVDDADPARTATLPAGWTHESLAAAAEEFFGPPPLPEVPESVQNYKFMLALDELGWLDAAEEAVTNAPRSTQIRWKAPDIYRSDAELIAMATMIGKTAADLDLAFRLAKTKQ